MKRAASNVNPRFFETPSEMRTWLQQHHATAVELLVGYHKRHVVAKGKASISWPQSVAEALCFGWIDGIRRSLDKNHYTIRFTLRRSASKWSAVNIHLVAKLKTSGRMTKAGRAVFQARKNPDSKGYKARKKVGTLDNAFLLQFKKHSAAWAFFQAQPPGYQKSAAWWVMQAKQKETRSRRMDRLVRCSAERLRLT